MSTTGTRNFRLYHDLLEAEGLEVVEVDLDTQEELHRTIYDSERGIKAVGKTMWSVNRFASYAQQIVDTGGADVLIMGCTEIPIVLESWGFRWWTLWFVATKSSCGVHTLINSSLRATRTELKAPRKVPPVPARAAAPRARPRGTFDCTFFTCELRFSFFWVHTFKSVAHPKPLSVESLIKYIDKS